MLTVRNAGVAHRRTSAPVGHSNRAFSIRSSLYTCRSFEPSKPAVTGDTPSPTTAHESTASTSRSTDVTAGSPSMAAMAAAAAKGRTPKRQAETTDGIASFLTRRFGLAGGLAWVAFLTVGSLGEQIKTRIEVANEEAATQDVQAAVETVLPSGVRYSDVRKGGGQNPIKGYLVIVEYTAKADGVEFESTRARGKPIVYLFGSRPFSGGICAGVEEAMSTMKAGGRRTITVPPEMGFGPRGAMLRPTEHVPEKQGIIPPNATLEYDLTLVRVSIPPS